MSLLNRRSLLCACVGGIPYFGNSKSCLAQDEPFFCTYSLEDGWTNQERSYLGRRPMPDDPSGVPQAISAIRSTLPFAPNFDVILTQGQNNASAITEGEKKYLSVDVDFLERVNASAHTKWGAIQVLAHEIGHHISGFSPNAHRSEFNADYWSGQALYRLGAAENASTAAILAVGGDRDSESHPNKFSRAEVIRRGWTDASQQFIDYSFCQHNCGR